jgi:hypothetical protein
VRNGRDAAKWLRLARSIPSGLKGTAMKPPALQKNRDGGALATHDRMAYFGPAIQRMRGKTMTACRASVKLLGAIAVVALFAATALPAAAQTIDHPEKKKVVTAKPAAKPKAAQARLSDQTSNNYWAVNSDLGKYTRDTPTERTAASRVPLRDAPGTVGFTSGTVRNGTLADGSTAAGMERYNQEQKSYVGMSWSVSSKDKNFPIPLLQRNTDW